MCEWRGWRGGGVEVGRVGWKHLRGSIVFSSTRHMKLGRLAFYPVCDLTYGFKHRPETLLSVNYPDWSICVYKAKSNLDGSVSCFYIKPVH